MEFIQNWIKAGKGSAFFYFMIFFEIVKFFLKIRENPSSTLDRFFVAA